MRDWDRGDPVAMTTRLRHWAETVGGPGAGVETVTRLPGHSGISYGFDLVDTLGHRSPLVIRVPPPGVRYAGVTDVLRQVPLLGALTEHGVPVPRVRHSGADERFFGTPYLVVDRVPGVVPGDVFAGRVPAPTRAGRDALFDDAMDLLARIHTLDAGRFPPGWDTPVHLPDLLDHWLALLERCAGPELLDAGRRVHAALRARIPDPTPPGPVHGDYYQNNWMVSGNSITAVLDWESAHLGPPAIDVGYVAMMYDPGSWEPALRTDLVDDDRPGDLLARYARVTGTPVSEPSWFRALAGLRFGALAAYFVRLHRTGRRPDPTWEVIGPSVPYMLGRAAELLTV